MKKTVISSGNGTYFVAGIGEIVYALAVTLMSFLLSFFYLLVELSEIKEVRRGWQTDTFNKIEATEAKRRSKKADYKSNVQEKTCFSIIYGPRNDTWDLVAPNEEIAEKWVRSLLFKNSVVTFSENL